MGTFLSIKYLTIRSSKRQGEQNNTIIILRQTNERTVTIAPPPPTPSSPPIKTSLPEENNAIVQKCTFMQYHRRPCLSVLSLDLLPTYNQTHHKSTNSFVKRPAESKREFYLYALSNNKTNFSPVHNERSPTVHISTAIVDMDAFFLGIDLKR